jgi:phosphatidylserine/phosphatidylglycerophosphate/cardiolipin synthase-like enzyme
MKAFVVLVLFVVLVVCSCSYTGHVIKEVIPEENGTIEVYFCPEDDCEGVLLGYLEDSIDIKCAFFDLELEEVIAVLDSKKAKVVTDEDNPGRALMHNKFCILDDNIVITGSMNPTDNGVGKNNNNLVVISSKYLVSNYNNEFEELWDGDFGIGDEVIWPLIKFNGYFIENYFCPEDNCEEKVLDVLDEANSSIYFMTFSFTSDRIGDFLIANAGELEIRGVFEKFQNNQWSEYRKMEDLDVKFDTNSNMMHHKVFIIDNETVILGSYNPTKNANENNDENILIIHDKSIAELFVEEFERLFYES